MFSVGDKVVYPMHGAGVIESIEEREILGQKQSYYVLKMPLGDMKVMIPTQNVEGIGIREIIDRRDVSKVYEYCRINDECHQQPEQAVSRTCPDQERKYLRSCGCSEDPYEKGQGKGTFNRREKDAQQCKTNTDQRTGTRRKL